MTDPVIGGGAKVSGVMVFGLAVVMLTVGGGVGIAALAQAELIDLEAFQQVTGYIGTLLATGLGGVLYGKRG